MNRTIRRVCRVVLASTLLCGTAALASAAPLSPSRFEVSYSGSGQMTVDVYGGYFDDFTHGRGGDFFVAGAGWNPVVFGESSGYGQFDGMTVFDNFVRYQYSATSGNPGYQWNMPSQNREEPPAPPAAVPEPGSMMLLGSGLLALAGIARRRLGRAEA